jgi:hypothetical protein
MFMFAQSFSGSKVIFRCFLATDRVFLLGWKDAFVEKRWLR